MSKHSSPLFLAVSDASIVQRNVVVVECVYKTSDVCDWKIIARKKQRSNTVSGCINHKGNDVVKFVHARAKFFET